jgi:hypothetical protein
MKKILLLFLAIATFLTSCDKENNDENSDDNIIVGGVYQMYTGVIINSIETNVNICDSIYKFNKIESCYSSNIPTSNRNILMINVIDTTKGFEYVRFDVFTSHIEPELFFRKDSFEIEKIRISRGGTREDFDNINTSFIWDSITFNNGKFSGKGRLKIPMKIDGKLNPDIFYPKQELKFEF